MTRLLVCPQQMQRLVAAEKTGIPLVYLPLHRSHLDYLLITWTSWHFGLRLPHIASGDNLNLSGLGWLLRATGAFFIHRRINDHDESGKDAIYRCRFGKPLLPKHGLISNVVTAVQQKVISDCYLVPVSYTYDNVAEGVFLDELMGVEKKRESVIGVIIGVFKSFGKSKRCGAVRMHYGKPVLLSDYLNALHEALTSRKLMPQLSRIPHSYSYRELVPWQVRHEEKADDRKAQSNVSFSLVAVVSALLMCKFRQGTSLEVLAADCQWLCDEIIYDGSDVVGWHKGETCGRNAVEYALQYLRDSVEREVDMKSGTDNVIPVNTHRQLINLAFNKNALVPLFALRSAIDEFPRDLCAD
ncbi:Acyltransferase [Oesophagostomum dentatum]|uniref:Acyltransferase n=1 Tax=Oesophagostomum dentatum TaxID=61180 RepID=A0A0B1TK26_OESDE|nr:Acyltransferase [Oesophagostomum dentatum]